MAGQVAVQDTDGLAPEVLRAREEFYFRLQSAAHRLARQGLDQTAHQTGAALIRLKVAAANPPYDRLTEEEIALACAGELTEEQAWCIWRAGRPANDPNPPPRAAR